MKDHTNTVNHLEAKCLKFGGFKIYYAIDMSVPSLHRESTDSPIFNPRCACTGGLLYLFCLFVCLSVCLSVCLLPLNH